MNMRQHVIDEKSGSMHKESRNGMLSYYCIKTNVNLSVWWYLPSYVPQLQDQFLLLFETLILMYNHNKLQREGKRELTVELGRACLG